MNVRYLVLVTLLFYFPALSCVHGGPVQGAEAFKTDDAPASVQDDRTPPDWFRTGVTYFEEGKFNEARRAFKEAVKGDYLNAEAHYYLGRSYRKLNDVKYALRALEESVRINPDFADAYRELGAVYRETGDENAALQSYRQVVSLDPGDAMAHFNLGELYLAKRMRKEAREAFINAVNIRPGFAQAHYHLGMIYVLSEDLESAFREYGILVDLDRRLAYELFDQIYK